MKISHEPAIIIACLAIVAVAAGWDLFTRRIPNLLTFGGIALGIGFHGAVASVDGGIHGAARAVLISLVSAVACSVIPAISFAKKQMGGGDVKLFAAIGAMTGPWIGLDALGFTYILAFVLLAPWRLYRAGVLKATVTRWWSKMWGEPVGEPVKLPPVVLGPAVLFGLCASLLRHHGLVL
jgi:prepilin peptidase CpaA